MGFRCKDNVWRNMPMSVMKISSNAEELLNQFVEKVNQLLAVDIANDTECIPYIGQFVQVGNTLNGVINKKKLYVAWKCLSKDENVEKSINELYNYVNNEQRAFYVAECFKKIAWSNSKIAASIIGLMLGEIKSQSRDFCNDDLILLNALENMTDFDIRYYKELMEGDYINDDIGKKYFDTTLFPEDRKEEYMNILEFGEKYRLFSISTNSIEGENSFFGTEYIPKKISNMLLDYINRVKQIINYDI